MGGGESKVWEAGAKVQAKNDIPFVGWYRPDVLVDLIPEQFDRCFLPAIPLHELSKTSTGSRGAISSHLAYTRDMRGTCIWCLHHDVPFTVEHAVPEVLGCPEGLILRDGVCECNSRLAFLDRVLADAFDVMRVMAGQPGKGGRQPKITARGNLKGEYLNGTYSFSVNAGPQQATDPRFGRISPPAGNPMDANNISLERDGASARISFSISIGHDSRFSRALHKVAYEWYAKTVGIENVLGGAFQPVRAFVLHGEGSRKVMARVPQTWEYRHDFGKCWSDTNRGPVVEFTLCGIPFLVDLGHTQHALRHLAGMMEALYGSSGWTILPPTSPGSDLALP